MRTLEIITAEYERRCCGTQGEAGRVRQAPVEGEEPPAEGQTRAYSVEQEAEIKTLLESAEALKKEMDDFVPPTVSEEERQQRQTRVAALLGAQTRAQQAGIAGRASADTQHGADRRTGLLRRLPALGADRHNRCRRVQREVRTRHARSPQGRRRARNANAGTRRRRASDSRHLVIGRI